MSRPVLWHIPISHYNEKVRWALDLKGVDHERRAPPPPSHMAVALWLTRGDAKTFPVLTLDGRSIGDSTAIIAELESRHPDPPLYPEDPGERARALELEDFFDEQLGPYSRLLAFHELRKEPGAVAEFSANLLPARLAANPTMLRLAGRGASAFVDARYGVGDHAAADVARAKIVSAFDRLDAELERSGGEYLAGAAFSVADLTAACLFFPLVLPPRAPQVPKSSAAYEEFRLRFRDRPGYRWVAEIFARHRRNPRRP